MEREVVPIRGDDSTARAELRTIGSRLREIQRLLSVRVEQENRRLEAAGLDPVTRARFFGGAGDADVRASPSPTGAAAERLPAGFVETLEILEPFETISVTLADGTTVEGRASAIDYVPNEWVRFELRPWEEPTTRYEIHSAFGDAGWRPLEVRRNAVGHETWEVLGEAVAVDR